jgi:hypothetical protein
MRKLFNTAASVILAAMFFASASAHAGRSCEAKRPTPQTVERGMTLAERTLTALDATGSKVVVLARAGQDLSKAIRISALRINYRTARADMYGA